MPNSLRHHDTRHHRLGPLSLLVACVILNCPARAGGTIDTAIGTPGVQVSPFNLRGPRAFAVFERGNGPQLVAAGTLGGPGSSMLNKILAWNGDAWEVWATFAGAGQSLGTIGSLVVADLGPGDRLYAAGAFTMQTSAGGTQVVNLGAYDGTTWSPVLGGGVPPSSGIRSMIFADGVDGPSLYITEGNSVNHKPVRRWNGTSWSTLGTQTIGGASPLVTALGRPDLGVFLAGWLYVGAQGAPGVHRWDGASWSTIAPLPASWTPARIAVEVVDGAIMVHATGPTSICPGGAGTCSYMHRWSNGAWTTVDGPTYIIEDLQWHDDGGGARLYACGLFDRVGDEPTGRLARLEGRTWMPVDHQVAGWPLGLASLDLGRGPELMVGGDFHFVDGLPTERVAGLSRGEVRTFAPDVTSQPLNATAFDLVWHDAGDGPSLHVGGSFVAIDGAPAACVARWNGGGWQAVGSGMLGIVDDLCVYDDRSGPRLFASGAFFDAGGGKARNIAVLDGDTWTPVGDGLAQTSNNPLCCIDEVSAMVVHDSGDGPKLYAATTYAIANLPQSPFVAAWDGSAWSAIPNSSFGGKPYAMASFDSGDGPRLYLGGDYGCCTDLRVWNGTSWSTPGGAEFTGTVTDLLVWDDGTGPALYATGDFFMLPGGVSAPSNVAKFDGATWTPLPLDGTSFAGNQLVVHRDRGRETLFLFGFLQKDGQPRSLARWNGSTFELLDLAVTIDDATQFYEYGLRAATTIEDQSGSRLVLGGQFKLANDVPVGGLVSWRTSGPPADLNLDGVIDGADLGLLIGSWGVCDGCVADLDGDGDVDGVDLGVLLSAWTG